MPSLGRYLPHLFNAWVFGSLVIGVAVGFLIGRWFTLLHEPIKLRKNRDNTLDALKTMLLSANELNENVGEHSSALDVAKEDLTKISASGQLEQLQGRLLNRVTSMVESNQKLENELAINRYRLEKQAQQLDASKKEARTDSLCDVGNRKSFDETLAYFASSMKSNGRAYALMLIDVDHFKRANDVFGHAAGDVILRSIGQSLATCVRPKDQVFRIGGDEFGVVFQDVDLRAVSAVGKRIRNAVELTDFQFENNSESTVVTLSMGLTVAEVSDTPETLFVRADEALYQSKEQGRNRLTIKAGNHVEEITTPENTETKKEDEADYTSYEDFKAKMAESL